MSRFITKDCKTFDKSILKFVAQSRSTLLSTPQILNLMITSVLISIFYRTFVNVILLKNIKYLNFKIYSFYIKVFYAIKTFVIKS